MTIKFLKLEGGGAKLFVDGRIDSNNAQSVQDNLLQIADQYKQITLDLGELSYISSAGLRALLMLQKKLLQTGGELTVARVSPAVAEIFELTGFNTFLNIEE